MPKVEQIDGIEHVREEERFETGSLRAAAHAFKETFGSHREFSNEGTGETFVVKIAGPTDLPKEKVRSPLDVRPVPQGMPLEVLAYRKLKDGSVDGAFFASIDDNDQSTLPDTGVSNHPFAGNWADELSPRRKMNLLSSVLWELTYERPPTEIPEVYGHQR